LIQKTTTLITFFIAITTYAPALFSMEITTTKIDSHIEYLKNQRSQISHWAEAVAPNFAILAGTRSLLRAYKHDYNTLVSLIKNNEDLLQVALTIPDSTARYSAFSLAMTTNEKKSFKENHTFIQQLHDLGYKPNANDKKIAFLEWWLRIPFDQMILLYYANKKETATLIATLPHEIVLLIAQFMFATEKSLL
jgi:hypothetical protein